MSRPLLLPISVGSARFLPSRWDFLALPIILGVFVLFAHTARSMSAPLSAIETTAISLDPSSLPAYALMTTLRMLAAMLLSIIFTFTYGTLAAKSRRAGALMVPMLDILQSVPILGFLSFTVTAFLGLFPGNQLGAECAAVFAIFTSQAWNMAFSFYQSLRTVPGDLNEVTYSFCLSGWQRFWRLEVPFAMPGLIWNMMMSMSGGWFFVVASEAISVGNTNIALPGIGSYVATAIADKNLAAVGWSLLAMMIVITLYDQLLFRPIVAWADKFRFEDSASANVPRSWFLDLLNRARWVQESAGPVSLAARQLIRRRSIIPRTPLSLGETTLVSEKWIDRLWYTLVSALAAYALWQVFLYTRSALGWSDVATAVGYGLITFVRVVLLIALASLFWVPIGVWIGMRPRWTQIAQPVAQFMAAFPANLMFPVAVALIVRFHLNADIWLSPLMVLGTQWYILFNVIAGASAFPSDLKDVATGMRIKGWLWWRKVALPGVFPYYLTGAISASGGSWNASVVSEIASWGNEKLEAHGLGAYIAKATQNGDYHRLVLGIAVMSLFVVILNRTVWRPLYNYAERRLRLG